MSAYVAVAVCVRLGVLASSDFYRDPCIDSQLMKINYGKSISVGMESVL